MTAELLPRRGVDGVRMILRQRFEHTKAIAKLHSPLARGICCTVLHLDTMIAYELDALPPGDPRVRAGERTLRAAIEKRARRSRPGVIRLLPELYSAEDFAALTDAAVLLGGLLDWPDLASLLEAPSV